MTAIRTVRVCNPTWALPCLNPKRNFLKALTKLPAHLSPESELYHPSCQEVAREPRRETGIRAHADLQLLRSSIWRVNSKYCPCRQAGPRNPVIAY